MFGGGVRGQVKGFCSNNATVFNLVLSPFKTWFSYAAASVCVCVRACARVRVFVCAHARARGRYRHIQPLICEEEVMVS